MTDQQKTEIQKTEQPRARNDEGTVFIGKKGIMAYVLAVMTQLNQQGNKDIKIKARGKSISTAVDVAEVVRTRFINDLKVKNIAIMTEELKNQDGSTSKVSAIEIQLGK
jgi:DNA-binding protein